MLKSSDTIFTDLFILGCLTIQSREPQQSNAIRYDQGSFFCLLLRSLQFSAYYPNIEANSQAIILL